MLDNMLFVMIKFIYRLSKCNDEEEYIQIPIYREKMLVEIFNQVVWKVAFEQ